MREINKLITPPQAVKVVKSMGISISIPTIIKYAKLYKIGHQLGGKGGRWVINSEKLMRFIDGKNTKTAK